MRIALTSDLHVDQHPEVVPLVAERFAALAPDVAIVAGDVSHDLDVLERTLATLARAAPRLAFVPGNHDLWCPAGAPSSRERYLELLPALARRAGAHPLTDEPLAVNGARLCGETGWFDFSLRTRAHDDVISPEAYREGTFGLLRWNDRYHVRFPGDPGDDAELLDDEALARWMVRRLAAKLAACAGHPTVVVTHHLAFLPLVVEHGDPMWDFVNGFLGSACLGEAIAAAPDVVLALAGHSHRARRARIERPGLAPIECVTSPVGYPREYRRFGDLRARVADRVTLVEVPAAGSPRGAPSGPRAP